ncbi:uncharacterized protein LOC126740703 [Anthonomus grandis grandis]|uniref:uncharacterized protein LOC126740703 n=1 Tax=Anthonomus grandis grandis TaxID=2921223 RepID=UPI0021659155|nr:uncharacterized protein LOC126740703 [Anthonomus grandis grandis]
MCKLTNTLESLEKNRKIIRSIISCVAFCGYHDLALRGASYGDGILEGLYKMRIDAGNTILKNHLEHRKKNGSYRSVDIQNEIISICGDVIKADCIKNVKISQAYSILADQTANISGKEQLSVGIRYFDEETSNIEEVFLGFAELTALDAKSIATTINEFLTKEDLDPDKCVGLGFDGCSTISGKEGGFQAILRKKYKKALFFHCSSHKLNLVINDLNALPEIRNTVGAIKDIFTFFRESVLRRKLIPNIPQLCETRWSEKYKSIRVFKENFCDIMEALETLSRDGNIATRKHAYQLHAAASKVSFIFSLGLIAKYSALLEPTVNVRSITIPYLDSIINSLEIRFSEENKPSFTLSKLHPAQMKNISLEELEEACEKFKNF